MKMKEKSIKKNVKLDFFRNEFILATILFDFNLIVLFLDH